MTYYPHPSSVNISGSASKYVYRMLRIICIEKHSISHPYEQKDYVQEWDTSEYSQTYTSESFYVVDWYFQILQLLTDFHILTIIFFWGRVYSFIWKKNCIVSNSLIKLFLEGTLNFGGFIITFEVDHHTVALHFRKHILARSLTERDWHPQCLRKLDQYCRWSNN